MKPRWKYLIIYFSWVTAWVVGHAIFIKHVSEGAQNAAVGDKSRKGIPIPVMRAMAISGMVGISGCIAITLVYRLSVRRKTPNR